MMRAFLLALVTALTALPQAPRGVTHVVLVGISEYRDRLKLESLKYANRDAHDLSNQPQLRNNLRRETTRAPLVDRAATRGAILEELRRVLTQEASPKDTVLVFVSGRGLATPDNPTGALLAHESEAERLNTGITVAELGTLIDKSEAEHIVLALDVLRDPPDKLTRGNNKINFLLADLPNLPKKRPKLDVILASQRGQTSREQEIDKRGHGIFAHFLMQGIGGKADVNSDGMITVSELFEHVQREVNGFTKRAQVPFRSAKSKRDPLLIRTAGAIAQRRRDHPLLIASAGGFDPHWLGQDPTSAPPNPASDWRARAVKLEEEGQAVLVLYGEGDQLPDDPQRLGRADFARCENAFGQAAALRRQNSEHEVERAAAESLEARALFCEGRKLLFDDALPEARRVLGDSIGRESGAPEAWNAMGIAHFVAGPDQSFDQAIARFEKAVSLAPNWAYARHNLALACIGRGDFERAIKEYRQAIGRTPYHAYLYYNLGVLLHRLNRKDEARQQYQRAIAQFRQQAVASPERAPVLRRNEAAAHNALGALLGSPAELEEALTLNPDLTPARYNLGVVQLQRGEVAAAIGTLEETLRRDEKYTLARLKLAECYQLQGDHGRALAQLRQAPGESAYVKMATAETLGDVAWLGGDRQSACLAYTSAAGLAPTDSRYRRAIEKKLRRQCR